MLNTNKDQYEIHELGDQQIDDLFGFPKLAERLRKVIEIGTKGKLDMQNIASAVFDGHSDAFDALPAAARSLGLLTPQRLYELCNQEAKKDALVEGLLARKGVSILVGDSGIGKSPLGYQLGLSVAAGVPFLGMETQQGPVVYADLENPLKGCREVLDSVALKFLRLPEAPESFNLWTPDHSEADKFPMEQVCQRVKPALVIVDSLRAFDPSAEDHRNSGEIMNRLRGTAKKNDAVILLIHHLRKPHPDTSVPRLLDEETRLIEWLNSASGSRAIVNQSDTRIAVEDPRNHGDAALVLRWHQRLVGEGGPLFLERVANEEGEPIGYRRTQGIQLFNDPNQREAFLRLPAEFIFKEAVAVYGRSDNPTNQWLRKCQNLGLIEKLTGRHGYKKIGPGENK